MVFDALELIHSDMGESDHILKNFKNASPERNWIAACVLS